MIEKGTPILISEDDLLNYISQEDIAIKYISNFHKIGQSFKSEFREENIPSSRVFVGRTGILMFKDFGDSKLNRAICIIEYVAYKYNLNYQDAINKIAIDFGLVDGETGELKLRSVRKTSKRGVLKPPSDLVIKIKRRNWTEKDIEYWNSYDIPIWLLERNNIKSISHVFFNGFPTEFSRNHMVYSYDYYWSRGIFRRKIYQPLSENYKWRTNTDYSVVQNYPNIPKKGNLLFIQSSYKDCMVMERMGYFAIAPNKEGSWVPEYYWEKLRDRWKNIIIYWNNDWEKESNPGLEYAKQFSKQYNLPYIHNPNGEPSDISDFVKKYSLKEGKELIRSLKLNYESN